MRLCKELPKFKHTSHCIGILFSSHLNKQFPYIPEIFIYLGYVSSAIWYLSAFATWFSGKVILLQWKILQICYKISFYNIISLYTTSKFSQTSLCFCTFNKNRNWKRRSSQYSWCIYLRHENKISELWSRNSIAHNNDGLTCCSSLFRHHASSNILAKSVLP